MYYKNMINYSFKFFFMYTIFFVGLNFIINILAVRQVYRIRRYNIHNIIIIIRTMRMLAVATFTHSHAHRYLYNI